MFTDDYTLVSKSTQYRLKIEIDKLTNCKRSFARTFLSKIRETFSAKNTRYGGVRLKMVSSDSESQILFRRSRNDDVLFLDVVM